MSVPSGEPRETLGKLRVNPSILGFSVALERPLGRRFRSGDTRRVVQPRRGVATVSTAESALCNCSAEGGRGVGGGGAIQRRPVIGCWGGARRRGGAGPDSDLRALAGGAARDTWCGTGAVSGRSPRGPSFHGGRCGLGMGWALDRAVWESPWSAINQVRDPGHPSESGGRSQIPNAQSAQA